MSVPQKEKKESIFARLFKRTGDAAKNESEKDDSAQNESEKDESARNKTDGEIIVQEESVENIPKRRWNSWVGFLNFRYFLTLYRRVCLS